MSYFIRDNNPMGKYGHLNMSSIFDTRSHFTETDRSSCSVYIYIFYFIISYKWVYIYITASHLLYFSDWVVKWVKLGLIYQFSFFQNLFFFFIKSVFPISDFKGSYREPGHILHTHLTHFIINSKSI